MSQVNDSMDRNDELQRAIFVDDEDFDKKYNNLLKDLDKAVFTKYRDKRDEICKLFIDKTIDLNNHRDLIAMIAVFTVTETDRYWARKDI